MIKRRLFGLTLAGALLAGAGIAQAATRHHVSQNIKLVAIFQSATFPNPGSKDVDVGIVSGKPGGGAIRQTITITGHPSATTYAFAGTNTDFYARGTTRSSFRGVAAVQPNGSFTVTGHGHYTGGTSAYSGARGRYSFAGAFVSPATPGAPAPLVAHIAGTLRY